MNEGVIICVEVDRNLHAILHERLGDSAGLTLICGDVLAGKNRILPEIKAALRSHTTGTSGHVKLVANLPYQVATPLVMNLLVDYPQVRRFVFTVQAEVGARIAVALARRMTQGY